MYLNELFLYQIYPLGFCGALYHNSNPGNHAYIPEPRPVNRLAMIDESWMEHLCQLGINAVYIGPLFESTYHGYDTADFFWIDRRLGSNADFINLVERFHSRGIKVIVDGVFNHVGRDFWAFKDVQKNRENSQYKNWFYTDFSGNNCNNDGFNYEGWEGHLELVKLNLENPQVKKHLTDAVLYWINEFGIDGIRFDVAYMVNRQFLTEISETCRNQKEDFILLGEMIHGTYTDIVNPQMLSSATNYECYKGMYSSLNDKNYFEIAYALNRQSGDCGIYKNLCLYNFTDNHDTDRVASTLKDSRYLYLLYLMLFTMPGFPCIYYGSEFGIEGKKENYRDENVRPAGNLETFKSNPHAAQLNSAIARFARIRKETGALRYGSYRQLYVSNQQFVFLRKDQFSTAIVAFNLSDSPVEITVPLEGISGSFTDRLNNSEYKLDGKNLKLRLYEFWGSILVKN